MSLFAIVFFALVILFPFYIMFVTSFKTQTALLINPLDLSIDFSKIFLKYLNHTLLFLKLMILVDIFLQALMYQLVQF